MFAATIAANPAREFTHCGSALHSGLASRAATIGAAHTAMFPALSVEVWRFSLSDLICPVIAAPELSAAIVLSPPSICSIAVSGPTTPLRLATAEAT